MMRFPETDILFEENASYVRGKLMKSFSDIFVISGE